MIHVVASIRIKADCYSEFLDKFKANVPNVLEEKGCVKYLPVVDIDSILVDIRHIPVFQHVIAPGHCNQCRDVGSNEPAAVTHSDKQRRAISGGHKPIGVVYTGNRQGVSPFKEQGGLPHRLYQLLALLQKLINLVDNDFGIRIRSEFEARFELALLELLEILYDAVADHGDFVPADVGMRILLGNGTVRCPTGVGDPGIACEVVLSQSFLEFLHTTDAASAREFETCINDGNAGRIVTPVFEALESLQKKRNNVGLRDRADYAAHGELSTDI